MITCPYCSAAAELVGGAVLYPGRPELHHKWFWRCVPCDAWVGCHPHTQKPLGRLADKGLRKAKMAAHAQFDPLWRAGRVTRTEAYGWLAEALGIPRAQAHIGMFDEATCWRVVALCKQMRAAPAPS